jgi:hypothetical protein
MHGSFDKPGESGNRMHRRWGIGSFALPLLLLIALIGLVITQPEAPRLISEAVQAEFAGADLQPVTTPMQIAKPTGEILAAKTY